MKPLFEMPFVFSAHITQNEGFQKSFKEMMGLKYERPKIVVIDRYSETRPYYGTQEWIECFGADGATFSTFPMYVENLPSDKDIAKNKKLFEFWRSTYEQLNK